MFLRNYWYVAASAGEIGRKPFRRVILNEPVVMFRAEDGTPVALEDRCPHRRLPLSMGRLIGGDVLQCHYHGLRFDRTGANLDMRSHFFKSPEMEVNRPLSNGTAARETDAGVSVFRDQRSQDKNRRSHRLDQLIRRFKRIDRASLDCMSVKLRHEHLRSQILEQSPHRDEISDIGNVEQRHVLRCE